MIPSKIKPILTCFLIAVTVTFTSCKKDTVTPPDNQGLVSANLIESDTKAQLQTLAVDKGAGASAGLMQYGVDFYKVIYKTTLNGNVIQASGLLAIPKNPANTPDLLSAQHGTIFSNSDAPSNFPVSFTGFETFASSGYITVIPDYIGFGVSSNMVHPYYDLQSSGVAVADMIKAVKYFLKTEHIAVSNKLFLMGYSEGGYVTLAAEKELETNPAYNITPTAVAAGAGGYDIGTMLAGLTTVSTYSDPAFLALFIQSYNTTYKWNRPLTDFFQPAYAAKIPQLLNGSQNEDQVNSQLTDNLPALFNDTFYSSFNNPTAETAFKEKVAENSFEGWFPKSPTHLYHGTADVDVPFITSQTTYSKFIAAGASNLTLTPIPGGTHTTSITPMFQDVTAWFSSFSGALQ